MILTCPACSSRYMINPANLGAGGRTVKCAKCGNKWFAEAAASVQQEQEIKEKIFATRASGQAKLPVKVPEKKDHLIPAGSFGVATLLVIIVAMILYSGPISDKLKFMQGAYNLIGLHKTTGIKLSDVKITKLPGDDKGLFLVQGRIENGSIEVRYVPVLRINAVNGQSDVLRSWEFRKKDTTLSAGEAIPFQTEIKVGSTTLKYITLDIGNFFEISKRK